MKYMIVFLTLTTLPFTIFPAAITQKGPAVAGLLVMPKEVTEAFNSLPVLFQNLHTEIQRTHTASVIEQKTTSKDVIEKAVRTIKDYCTNIKTILTDYLVLLDLFNQTELLQQKLQPHIAPFSKPIPRVSEIGGLESITEEPSNEITALKRTHNRLHSSVDYITATDITSTASKIKQQLQSVIDHYNKDLTDAHAKKRTIQSMINDLYNICSSYEEDYRTHVGDTLPKAARSKEFIILEYTIPHALERIENRLTESFNKDSEFSKSLTLAPSLEKAPSATHEELSLSAASSPLTSTATGGTGPTGSPVAVVFLPLASILENLEKKSQAITTDIDALQKTVHELEAQHRQLETECDRKGVTVQLQKESPRAFEKSNDAQNIFRKTTEIQTRFKSLHALEKSLRDNLSYIYFKTALKNIKKTAHSQEQTIRSLIKEISDELHAAEKAHYTPEELTKLQQKYAEAAIAHKNLDGSPQTYEKINNLEQLTNTALETYTNKSKTRYELIQKKMSLLNKVHAHNKALAVDPFAEF